MSTPSTIETFLAELNGRGIEVQNLFQLRDGSGWQCNLRTTTMAYEYGLGKTMLEAARAAYWKLPGLVASPPTTPKTARAAATAAVDPFDE